MAALADNPRILVTGATGFIGTPLCARLDELGHPVTALTRDIHRARERLGDNVQLVTDLNELERTVFGGVINLAGEPLAKIGRASCRERVGGTEVAVVISIIAYRLDRAE